MMYAKKMAVAVKSKGRVLREAGENVFLPFGAEYTILIKNLNSVRALVKVWIDGVDATEGTGGLIVPANDSIDFERFIKNGNLSAGNRFKFIEKTDAISNHRGDRVDDGLIRIEFEFERVPAPAPIPVNSVFYGQRHPSWPAPDWSPKFGGITCSTNGGVSRGISKSAIADFASLERAFVNQASFSATCDSYSAQNATTATTATAGITVPGSVSDQSFTTGYWIGTAGPKEVMIFRMLGKVEGMIVKTPVTVKHKPTCTSCGKVNKTGAKFCSECGTGLTIV